MSKKYAIIDIETTGGRAERNRITEVAIMVHDGEKVLETWESLINPECPIPYAITELTGITNEMVQDAPRFHEVARAIHDLTEGAVFVAHNVRFDYSFIRAEFARLGFTFTRKTLCTVRLARKSFPGLRSYSLGNLIRHFGIKVDARHRAMADTYAASRVFEMALNGTGAAGSEEVESMVNLGIKEALLPKNISLETIHALPETPGVYYFHDEAGGIVYVGKSINIKKRVAEHFAKKTYKASKLQQLVHEISCEETGSEIAALLLESHEIKRLRPVVNRAQRVRHFPYAIHAWQNEAVYWCLEAGKVLASQRKQLFIINEYPKPTHARGRLQWVQKEYALCGKLLGLTKGSGPCFPFHLKECYGACVDQEDAESYNERARAAIDRLGIVFDHDFFLLDAGRTPQERTVVHVEDGEYRGFGYVDTEEAVGGLEVLRDSIRSYHSNPETKRIIRGYMSKPKKGVKLIKY